MLHAFLMNIGKGADVESHGVFSAPGGVGERPVVAQGELFMRAMKYCLLAGLTLGLLGLALPTSGEEKAKYTIKEVMKKAHKEGLFKKVADGKADKAEKDELVSLYTALAANKPPKGDAKAWGSKTEAIVKAAKDVAAGKEGSEKDLKGAVQCKNCHDAHK
jgi:hypothetical protein